MFLFFKFYLCVIKTLPLLAKDDGDKVALKEVEGNTCNLMNESIKGLLNLSLSCYIFQIKCGRINIGTDTFQSDTDKIQTHTSHFFIIDWLNMPVLSAEGI